MATSLTTIKARVASELNRDDLTSAIATAISSAILEYQSQRFEFNEKQASFNTVADQQGYTSGDTGFPTDIAQIDRVRVTDGGVFCYPTPITFSELQDRTARTTDTGAPTMHWAWYAATLFLYPIPSAVHSVQLSYLQRKAAPANDAATDTVWTNAAADLIVGNAKKRIARNIMRNEPLAQSFEVEEAQALATLKGESRQLKDDGSGLVGSW